MSIQFYNGVILFVDGQIAMDPACCCSSGCTSSQYGVIDTANNGWQPAPHVDGTSIRGKGEHAGRHADLGDDAGCQY